MSRCKACNVIMNEYELKRIDRMTGDYSELCTDCLTASIEAEFDAPYPDHIDNPFDFLTMEG